MFNLVNWHYVDSMYSYVAYMLHSNNNYYINIICTIIINGISLKKNSPQKISSIVVIIITKISTLLWFWSYALAFL